jgi:hypothetical protein
MSQICKECLGKGKDVDMTPDYEVGSERTRLIVWACPKCRHTIIRTAEASEKV